MCEWKLQERADINPLNAELNPTCPLLALLRVHHILHISGIRVKTNVFRRIFVRSNETNLGESHGVEKSKQQQQQQVQT